MPAPNVDVVIVLDASESMSPCFSAVREHLHKLLRPLQGQAARVRFGLVYHSVYDAARPASISMLNGLTLADLYSAGNTQKPFFTEEPDAITRALNAVVVSGGEDSLLGLDVALDFPFGSLHSTKRVVALLSDEPLEGGYSDLTKIPQLIEKTTARRIKLFMALPDSQPARELEQADGCEFEAVDGGNGLARVDFARLFDQMGKSISASTLQHAAAENYRPALFGQDRW